MGVEVVDLDLLGQEGVPIILEAREVEGEDPNHIIPVITILLTMNVNINYSIYS